MTQAALDNRPLSAPLPAPIRRVLTRVRRRLRGAAVLRGLGFVTLIGAIGAVLGMGADFAGPLPQAVRWAIWGAWLAAVAAAMVLAVLRPWLRGAAALDLAAVAQRAHPELGERLTGAVALLSPRRDRPVHGAPALIAALADEAAAEVAIIDPARAVPWRRPARWFALGLAVLGLTAAPAILWPATYGILARRFVAPWVDLERVGRFVITVAPGDRVAAIGADVTMGAHVRPRFGNLTPPESAWLEWTESRGNGGWHRVAMPVEEASAASTATRSFAVTLPRLTGSLNYRVASGSALSRSYRITALEPPAVAALAATVEPPAYTRLAVVKVADPSRIEAWEGSRVTLNVAASRPVTAINVAWPAAVENAKQPATTTSGSRTFAASLGADGKSGTATIAAEASGAFAVTLRDAHGLNSRPEAEGTRRVMVRLDAAPVVALTDPEAAHETSPGDVLTLRVEARDDVAVASVELHYTIDRRRGQASTEAAKAPAEPESGHIAAELPGLGTRGARGEMRLELARLELAPGDTLAYRVRVADNRPAPRGPNVTWSPGRALSIVAKAEPLLARQREAERQRLQAELEEIRQAAAANRRETEQLRYAADAVQRGNGRWERAEQQALEEREAAARAVTDRLQLLSRALAGEAEPGLRELARPARQIAEVEAESSRAMLDQARRDAEAAGRLNDLRQADHRLAALGQRLDELKREFDALARRDADFQRLRDLAEREEAIAAGTRAQAPVDQLRAEQIAVQKDLDALLKKSPELRGDVLAEQADQADALARKAHELAGREREEARRSGDTSKQAGPLAKLAEAQRALEEDARRLALDVDAPLVESGRGRLNTNVVHDAVAPLEHGDLDQARQRLEGAEVELRRLAHDLVDAPADPRAIAQRLVRRQEALGTQVKDVLKPLQDNAEPTAEELAARTAQLRPLAERQEAIARLAAEIALAPPAASESASKKTQGAEALRNAQQATTQAAEALRNDEAAAPEIATRQSKAQAALKRLADALPDPSARRTAARKSLDETRKLANEAARDLERHLRETTPRPGNNSKSSDPARAADELARRLEPVVKKQAKAADALAALEAGPRDAPQHERARERLKAMTDTLETLRAADVPAAKKQELRDTLPRLQAEARAALDRLDQKLAGRVPADDLAAELAEDQHALGARLAKPDGAANAEAAEDQLRIATALRNLDAPDALPAQAEAVRRAEKAAEALRAPAGAPDRDPKAAVAAAAEAAEALAARLARESGPAPPARTAPAPADPELSLPPTAAATAGQLARRQRQLRERLQAVLAERIAPQQELRDQAVALGRELADLRDRARPLSDRARGPAQEAAQTLGEQAPRAMDQGADRLAQGQATAARDTQREAASIVERGAQQAEDLAAALHADGRPANHDPAQAQAANDQAPPRPLASARAAMSQATQQLAQAQAQAQQGNGNGDAAQAAGQSMRQAARDLRAAAERGSSAAAAGANASAPAPGAPTESDSSDPQGTLAGMGTPDLAELKATIARKAGRSWGELPGHLRTEILQMAQGRYRDDYARIIQLYFREIATGAGSKQP